MAHPGVVETLGDSGTLADDVGEGAALTGGLDAVVAQLLLCSAMADGQWGDETQIDSQTSLLLRLHWHRSISG